MLTRAKICEQYDLFIGEFERVVVVRERSRSPPSTNRPRPRGRLTGDGGDILFRQKTSNYA